MLQRLSTLRLALALGFILCAARFVGCGYLHLLDQRTIDYRLLQRGPSPASPDVVIVAVDNRSIAKIGRWPWPRDRLASLVDRIASGEPAVVGFDIVQSEQAFDLDVSELGRRVEALDPECAKVVRSAGSGDAGEDQVLAESLRRLGTAVLGYFFDPTAREPDLQETGVLRYDVVEPSATGRGEQRLAGVSARTANLPIIRDAAHGEAFFNVFPDRGDGSVRRMPLALRYGEHVALPLALGMLRVYRPNDAFLLRFADFGVDVVRIGGTVVPVAEDGQLLLNYRGPRRSFRHIPAVDLLEGTVSAAELGGKLVLVGVTADAVADARVTPLDGGFPGVELHATVLDNLLRGDYLQQPKWIVLVELGAILLCVWLLGVLLRSQRGWRGVAVSAVMVGVYVLLSQQLFLSTGIPLGLVYPSLAILLVSMAVSVFQYAVEERDKRVIHRMFATYVSPEVAGQLAQDPARLKLGGEEKELSILLSDIRGFTVLSETLSPTALCDLLNRFFTPVSHVIFDHKGTIDKYMGDAIMAFWNAPAEDPDHRANACRAALGLVRALPAINQDLTGDDGDGVVKTPLKIGIGVSTGRVIVGNMGSDIRFDYTVLGDSANLASRLQDFTKTIGIPIIVTDTTRNGAEDLAFLEVFPVVVRGKHQAVRIYALLGEAEIAASEEFRSLAAAHEGFLQCYMDGQLEEALQRLETCRDLDFRALATDPDHGLTYLHDLYEGRMARWLEARAQGSTEPWQPIYFVEGDRTRR